MPDDEKGRPSETEKQTRPDAGAPLDPPADAALPNKRLGDFELLREIGRGGMGVVYEARQVSLKRRIALKVLPPGLGLTERAVKRFEREAQAAAMLHHTNIVPVHATGEDQGCHYYAMELVEGQPLSRVLDDLRGEKSNPLMEATVTQVVAETSGTSTAKSTGVAEPTSLSDTDTGGRQWFDTVAKLVADVGDALHYAHERGVIHRDVKPANLLLSGDGRLCLGDFGLARVAQEPGMTVSGSFLGTPAYMSPEQIAAGRVTLDHRTDVYSLGAVLYEMLTLQRAFPGDSREEILTGIMTKEPRPPRRINPRVPVDLETICLKALEKDPDRRYASGGELAEDLRRYLGHGLIAARRAGPLRRGLKLVRRHPVAAVTVVALLLVVGLAGLTWRISGERSTAEARQAVAEARQALSDARLLQDRGAYSQALVRVESALALEPDFVEARLVRARLLIDLGRPDEAAAEGEELLAQNPDDWRGHLILAVAGVDHVSAKAHTRAVEEHAPETADAYYLRALLAANPLQGSSFEPRQVEALLDRALELDPGHVDTLMMRINRLGFGLKRFDEALDACERLTIALPRSTRGRRMRADLLFQQHDYRAALEEITRAIEFDPDDPENYLKRAEIGREIGLDSDAVLADLDKAIELDPRRAKFYDQRAWTQYALGRMQDAVLDAERAFELDPGSAMSIEGLLMFYRGSGQPDKAASVCARLAETAAEADARGQPWPWHALARCHWRLEDYEPALEAIDRAVAISSYWGQLIQRAMIRESAGDEEGMQADCLAGADYESDLPGLSFYQAQNLAGVCDLPERVIDLLTRVIDAAPHWADAYLERGRALRRQERHEESLADLTRAAELAPQWPRVFTERARTYEKLERREESRADQARVLELTPGRFDALATQLRQAMQSGEIEKALELGHQLVELAPDRWDSLYYRGWALFANDRKVQALQDLDRAIEISLDVIPAPRLLRGYVFVSQGRFEQVLDEFQRYLKLNPKDGYIHAQRAILLLHLGREEEAEAESRRALELGLSEATLAAMRGEILFFEAERCERGRTELQRARDVIEEDDAIAWVLLAWAQVLGEFYACPDAFDAVQALADAQVAFELSPDGYGRNVYGAALYRAGRYGEALDVLEADRREHTLHDRFFKTMCDWQLGNRERARQRFEQASALQDANRLFHPEAVRCRKEAEALIARDG